jgi:threonine synthase
MSKLKEWKVRHIVQDSSGNAGAAIAAYAAKAGIPCDIFLPKETSESKVAQIQAYGANIIRVNGNRKQTAAVTFEAAQKSYYASHSFNPFFFQGTKTFAYEICEQLSWKSPDIVVLPAGNGTLLLGCYIGFKELAELDVIKKIPKLIAVQSQNCSPLVYINENPHFDANLFEGKGTIAEGIAIPNPVRLKQMLHAVIETNGEIITVSDIEIAKTWKWLASNGHFIEPTSAATIAGLNKFADGLSNELNIVSVFTGSGLKSIDKIQKILSDPSL